MQLQADLWYKQQRFIEAKSEALFAAEVFERFSAVEDLEVCRATIQTIEEAISGQPASHVSDVKGEILETILLPTPINSLFSAHGTGHHPQADPLQKTKPIFL